MDDKYIIAAVIGVIVFAILVYAFYNRKGLLTKAALDAVAKAQQAWGSHAGQLKFAEVYSYLKFKFPIITFFLSEKKLAEIIENSLAKLKEIISEKAKKDEENGVENSKFVQSVLEQMKDNDELPKEEEKTTEE